MGLPNAKQLLRDGRKAASLARIAVKARAAKDSDDPTRARRAIAQLMVGERGLPAKLAQFLGSNDDAFRDAVDEARPEPLETIETTVEEALGRPLANDFREFAGEGHAASIGQVHRARLRDGTDVAVKVRYPEIEEHLASELRILGLVPGFGPLETWGFDLDGYRELIASDIGDELDYLSEAERQQRMGDALHIEGLVVPRVHYGLCRKNLLIQNWESGLPLAHLKNHPLAVRKRAAQILLRTFLRSLFEIGELHADPNPANLAFRIPRDGEPEIVLMDWGCTLRLAKERRLALLKLIVETREAASSGAATGMVPLDVFGALGFDVGKLVAIERRLPALCRMLLSPFLVDQPLNASTWRLAERIESLLGEHRWWFRAAGPPDSLLLMRAFHGLFHQLAEIGVALPFWPELEASVSPATFDEARAVRIASCAPEIAAKRTPVDALAHALRVEVIENGAKKVSLSMPAEAALGLPDLVPEEARTPIERQGLDLMQLTERIRESGIAPQAIVEVEERSKRYRVWLE